MTVENAEEILTGLRDQRVFANLTIIDSVSKKPENADEAIDAVIAHVEGELSNFHGRGKQKGLIEKFNDSGGTKWGPMTMDKGGLMGKYQGLILKPLMDVASTLQELGTGTIDLNNTSIPPFDVDAASQRVIAAYKKVENSILDNVPDEEIALPLKFGNQYVTKYVGSDQLDFSRLNALSNIHDLTQSFQPQSADNLKAARLLRKQNTAPELANTM